MTKTEDKFVTLMKSFGISEVRRTGWPDFLVRDSNGSFYCVEVKNPGDPIRANQAKMFQLIEQLGVKVFIWSPVNGNTVVPWAEYTKKNRWGRESLGCKNFAPIVIET